MRALSVRRMMALHILCGWAILCFTGPAWAGEHAKDAAPWFDREKIRFFWGQWDHFKKEGIARDEVMKNLSRVGASVFVEHYSWGAFDVESARLAQKYGIRYFGLLMINNARHPAQKMQARLAVNKHGLTSVEEAAKGVHFSPPPYVACPLEENVIQAWQAT